MRYVLALIVTLLLFSCRTPVLDSEDSFVIDNGQFSFAASKTDFKLADFKLDGDVISLISQLEDSLTVSILNPVQWRISAPLHDDHTLIYNQSSTEPNLKFTRSIYVDREKSQVKIRYNLKNRNAAKSIRFKWALRAKVSADIEVQKEDKSLSLVDGKSAVLFKSDKKLRSLVKAGTAELFLNENAQSQVLQPLNRFSWQVILDIDSQEEESFWCFW